MQDSDSGPPRMTTSNCAKSTTTSKNTSPKATAHTTTSPPIYHNNQPAHQTTCTTQTPYNTKHLTPIQYTHSQNHSAILGFWKAQPWFWGSIGKFKMADLIRSEIFVLLHISRCISNIYGIFQSGKCTRMVYHMSVKELYVILKSVWYFSVFRPIFTNLHPSIFIQYIQLFRIFLGFPFFGL